MKVLFICTHNRCRSILAEAIANHYGKGLIQAKSAGSAPVGEVHPLTLKFLSQNNIPCADLCSQSWDEFEGFEPDLVITVCDKAAQETCPVWFGKAQQLHWGLSDPSSVNGAETEVAQAFNGTISQLKEKINDLIPN